MWEKVLAFALCSPSAAYTVCSGDQEECLHTSEVGERGASLLAHRAHRTYIKLNDSTYVELNDSTHGAQGAVVGFGQDGVLENDKCANFAGRNVNGPAIASGIAGAAGGGAAVAAGIGDLVAFAAKLGAASGALGIAGGAFGIVGELFFDDPNTQRIEAIETAVDCLEEKFDKLAKEVKLLTARMNVVEAGLNENQRQTMKDNVEDAVDQMEHFIEVTAAKIVKIHCLPSPIKHDGQLYHSCNAQSLWDKVEEFRHEGLHSVKQFAEKAEDVMQLTRTNLGRDRQRFWATTIVAKATAGMQVALIAYSVINSWAVKICEWRYKYFKQQNSIPWENNHLCVNDPVEAPANQASHPLKEIVTDARDTLVQMAGHLDRFLTQNLDQCKYSGVVFWNRPNSRHFDGFNCGPSLSWRYPAPRNFVARLAGGCCRMKSPFHQHDTCQRCGTGWRWMTGPDRELWAAFAQPVKASLTPAQPARELTLQTPRRRRTGWGGGYYGGGWYGGKR